MSYKIPTYAVWPVTIPDATGDSDGIMSKRTVRLITSLLFQGDAVTSSTKDAVPKDILTQPLPENFLGLFNFAASAINPDGSLVSSWVGFAKFKNFNNTVTVYDQISAVSFQDAGASTWSLNINIVDQNVILTATGANGQNLQWFIQWFIDNYGGD